jgi:hypothetical protein
LIAIAGNLREVARSLVDMAHSRAGMPENPCIAEYVLFESGGVDHWVSPQITTREERFRLKLGLRNAIRSIRG